VTSLRRRAQTNAGAASYWLRRVLDDGGRRDCVESIVQGVPGAEPAMHRCLVVFNLFTAGCREAVENQVNKDGGVDDDNQPNVVWGQYSQTGHESDVDRCSELHMALTYEVSF